MLLDQSYLNLGLGSAQKALFLAERYAEYVEGDSFHLTLDVTSELTVTAELAPDTVVVIEWAGELVLYAYERYGEAMKVLRFIPDIWLLDLNNAFQSMKDSAHR